MKMSFYVLTRVVFGLFILMSGFEEGVSWKECFMKMYELFSRKTNVKAEFIKYLILIVSYLKFITGIFITAGFFTKHILKVACVLYAFITLVFIYLNGMSAYAIYNVIFFSILLLLLLKARYNKYSLDNILRIKYN